MAGAPVSLDDTVLARLTTYIKENDTDQADAVMKVPTSHFTDPERLRLEREYLLGLPLIVGHVSEVPQPGSFYTRTIFGIPLLVIRQKDGNVAVFQNMCRHRGGRVEQDESGRKSVFMCQYHGWSYTAEEGRLAGVPYADTFGEVDKSCNGLRRFASEVRHGLIFATLKEGEARSVADFLGEDVDRQLAPWNMDESTIFMDHYVPLPVNWKLVVDGTLDPLHAKFLHPKPGGVGARSVNHHAVFDRYGYHGKMFMGRKRLQRLIDEKQELRADSGTIGTVMMLYPNNILVEAPDHIELWSIWPDERDPGQAVVHFRFLVRPEILNPEMEARINKSWEVLRDAGMEEDFPMEHFIQENSAQWDGFLQYGRNEKPTQHLHRRMFEDIDGGVSGPGTIVFA